MVSYKKLWITLAEREMTKTQLREKVGMSTATLSRLGKNEYVELRLLDKICNALNCKIENVLEILPDQSE